MSSRSNNVYNNFWKQKPAEGEYSSAIKKYEAVTNWHCPNNARIKIVNRLAATSPRHRYTIHGNDYLAKTQPSFALEQRRERPRHTTRSDETGTSYTIMKICSQQDNHANHYYRPKTRQKGTISEELNLHYNGLRRKTILTTKTYPRLLRNMSCPHGISNRMGQYCDVLGPASCHACTELLNRKMVDEHYRDMFPSINTTTVSLVAPTLSYTLLRSSYSDGDNNNAMESSAADAKLPRVTRRHYGARINRAGKQ